MSFLFYSFFFFYCSADHRDLHSFPTRRSSDLVLMLSTMMIPFPVMMVSLFTIFRWLGDVTGSPWIGTFKRSEEHTSELQSPYDLVCRLLLEKKKKKTNIDYALNLKRLALIVGN